jgi:enamine deaminase RidA (YjgF/YER057c/UK114 family)
VQVERRLAELGIVLPKLPTPIGNFVDAVQVDSLVFLAGKGSRTLDGVHIPGRVGENVTTAEASGHARLIGLYTLAVLRETLGDLDRVKRIVKVLGLVNAVPDFSEQPKVINGFSDLMVEVFGDKGRHARSAVGAGSLPGGITVEIEAIVQVENR